MTTKTFGLAVLLFYALVQTAGAATWIEVIPKTQDAESASIDVSSTTLAGPVASAWFLFKGGGQRTRGDGTAYSSSVQLLMFDCQFRKMAVAESYFYAGVDGTGNFAAHETFDTSQIKWLNLPPDSKGESMMQVACRKFKQP